MKRIIRNGLIALSLISCAPAPYGTPSNNPFKIPEQKYAVHQLDVEDVRDTNLIGNYAILDSESTERKIKRAYIILNQLESLNPLEKNRLTLISSDKVSVLSKADTNNDNVVPNEELDSLIKKLENQKP